MAYDPATRIGFQIAERFFNIWYLMRASRRVRRRLIWLVEFLKLFYGRDQIEHRARRQLTNDGEATSDERLRHAEYTLALAQSVETPALRNALESTAMRELLIDRELRDKLAGIVDLDGEDASLKPFVERHRVALEIQEAVTAAKVSLEGWDAARFAELLGGSLSLSSSQNVDVAGQIDNLSDARINEIQRGLNTEKEQWEQRLGASIADQLYRAIREGHMVGCDDVRGAEVAAIALNAPELTAHAIAFRLKSHFSSELLSDLERALSSVKSP